ncbi:hypothetical protein [Rouxiella badensis]|uniref:hypothetical protein n=1 Tax=Rouxiella badensis TaxID=1646377 RepID=UPI001787BE6B|nr:hypothetical protein [Rouxiella badensis]QOI58051.1 hypothetical protein H2866_23445 [Rouxiella badensis subsp. acadiensis]
MDAFKILELKEEVDKLEARLEASHNDALMSFEQRLELSEEYTKKYNELNRLCFENITKISCEVPTLEQDHTDHTITHRWTSTP